MIRSGENRVIAANVDHTLVHRSLKRAEEAGLYRKATKQVNRANFEENLPRRAPSG